jgi:hypothetical protein
MLSTAGCAFLSIKALNSKIKEMKITIKEPAKNRTLNLEATPENHGGGSA